MKIWLEFKVRPWTEDVSVDEAGRPLRLSAGDDEPLLADRGGAHVEVDAVRHFSALQILTKLEALTRRSCPRRQHNLLTGKG